MNEEPCPLTDNQQAIYDFLREYFLANDQLPPTRTIKNKFGFSSQTAVMAHMVRIEQKGWIEKNENDKWRFTKRSKQ